MAALNGTDAAGRADGETHEHRETEQLQDGASILSGQTLSPKSLGLSFFGSPHSRTNGGSSRRRKDRAKYFNILVVGSAGSGKSSLVRLLMTSLGADTGSMEFGPTSECIKYVIERECEGDRVIVSIWDSPGLRQHDNLEEKESQEQVRSVLSFIEERFKETFQEVCRAPVPPFLARPMAKTAFKETKVIRDHRRPDSHIHVCLYLVDPVERERCFAHLALSQLDRLVIAKLARRTVVVPIIAKADTLPTAKIAALRTQIVREMAQLELPDQNFMDGEETQASPERSSPDSPEHSPDSPEQTPSGAVQPLSVIAPDYSLAQPGSTEPVPERVFPWGAASAENPGHCDFVLLKDSLLVDWRDALREWSAVVFYENWRTELMQQLAVQSQSQLQPEPQSE